MEPSTTIVRPRSRLLCQWSVHSFFFGVCVPVPCTALLFLPCFSIRPSFRHPCQSLSIHSLVVEWTSDPSTSLQPRLGRVFFQVYNIIWWLLPSTPWVAVIAWLWVGYGFTIRDIARLDMFTIDKSRRQQPKAIHTPFSGFPVLQVLGYHS